MSISTPFCLIYAKFPKYPPSPNIPSLKTICLSMPQSFQNFSLFRPITTDWLPSKPLASLSSSSSPFVSLQPIEELPPKLQEIVKLFQAVEEPKAKYEQLLFYGKHLTPLNPQFKTVENKVQGCVSQVWVRAYLGSDGKSVVYEADSDSVLTRGLAALLVQGLSGQPVEEILRVSPDFIVLLGLQQSLTPSRNNGFLNMFKLMQRKALQLFTAKERTCDQDKETPIQNSKSVSESRNGDGNLESGPSNEEAIGTSGSNSNGGVELGNRGKRIKEKLERALRPSQLEVEDISYQHAGHVGVRVSDGETHFNLKVVSKEFEGKSSVKRHRMIYGLLQDELQSGLHALSIMAKTPSEV